MLVTLRGERVNQVIYPFILKISSSILFTAFQTILMTLIWRNLFKLSVFNPLFKLVGALVTQVFINHLFYVADSGQMFGIAIPSIRKINETYTPFIFSSKSVPLMRKLKFI